MMFAIWINDPAGNHRCGWLTEGGSVASWSANAMRFPTLARAESVITEHGFENHVGVKPGIKTAYVAEVD